MSHTKIVEADQVLYKTPHSESGQVIVKHAGSGVGGIQIEDVDALHVSSIKSKNGVEAMTLTDDTVEFKLPFGLDMNDVNMTEVDIDSGTIDGATIGASSHSTGKFTNLTVTSTSQIEDHMNFLTAKELRFGTALGGANCRIEGDGVTMDINSVNVNLQGTTATSLRGGTVTVDAGGTLNLQASDAENYLVCNHSTEAVETIKPLHIKSTSKVEGHMNFLTDQQIRLGTAGGGSSAYIKGDNSTMNINAPTINLQGTTATSLRGGTITVDAAADLNLKASDNESYITCSHSNSNVLFSKAIDLNNVNISNANGLISNQSALGSASLHQTQDHFLVSDNGACKKVTFSNLEDSIFANVSGDITIAAGGAATLGSGVVEGAMVADDLISAQGALGSASVAQADLVLIDDGPGTLKKVTFSNFEDSIFGNVSADITIAAGGAATIANDAVESGMLNDNVISGQTELASASLHQTEDHFLVSDNGALRKMTFSNVEDSIFGNVSGDITIAAGGAATIGAGAVESDMLNDNCISGQGALGGASMAQADLLLIDDGPGTLKKVTFSNFEDSIFGNVSGDATAAAGGALTVKSANTFNKKSVITTDSTGNRTITAAEMIGGYFHMAGASGGSTPTLTTDTAANIVGAMNNPVVGSSFVLHIQNTASSGGQKIIMAVGTGVTGENLSGSSADIPENFCRTYLVIATNVSGGSEAVTFRQLGKRDMR